MNTNPDANNIRLHGEEIEYTPEMILEYKKCRDDIAYFAEKYFYIVTLDKGKEVIKLWDFQKKLLQAMTESPDELKRHLCVLSSRQSAKTTTCTIFMLHYALFNEDKTIAILANKESTAISIMKRVRIAYEMLPKWLQQGITTGGWNKKTISFENGTTILAASTSSSALRGISANVLLLDEFAFVPDSMASEFMSSVYPIIVSGTTTKMIIVSTPNGMNHFHNIYSDQKNNFYKFKIAWSDVPGRDDEWKESVIRDIGITKWLQEFECNFLGSTTTLVDGSKLEKIRDREPIDVKDNGCLLIYEYPEKGAVYVMGVDPGKGLGHDYSTIQILRIYGLEKVDQVAVYRNNRIDPHNFAGVVVNLSNIFNKAYILAENNGKEGGMLVEAIHWIHHCESLINMTEKELGITSTAKSKFSANMNMKRYIENDFVKIHDEQTRIELGKYEEVNPNIFKAKGKGDTDDSVTSLIWGLYFAVIADIIGLTFDARTKEITMGNFTDTLYSNDIPVCVIDDGSDMFGDYEFIDDNGTVWKANL